MSVAEYPESLAWHYDHDYAALRKVDDVPFYMRHARESGGPCLEVGCGTGRVMLPIARAGQEITGADPSATMRAALREKLAQEPAEVSARVRVVDGRFDALGVHGPFALVTSPFRAFMHVPDADGQRAAFREMTRVLAPGGRLVLDLFDFDAELGARFREPRHDTTYVMGGRTVERWSSSRYDPESRLLAVTFKWIQTAEEGGGAASKTQQADFTMRCTSAAELEALVAHAGLEIEALDADFAGTPYDPAHPGDIVLIARRPSG